MNNAEMNVESVTDMDEQKQQEWLNGHPTRGEVTQFVNLYINNEVIPAILNNIGGEIFKISCKCDILMKKLIESGITTPEQFEKEYSEYVALQMKRFEDASKDNKTQQ